MTESTGSIRSNHPKRNSLRHRLLISLIGICFPKYDRFIFMLMALGFDEGFCVYALGYQFDIEEKNAKIIVAKVLGSPFVTEKLADLDLKY